jgi:integrase
MQVTKIGKKWYSDFMHNGKRIKRALSPFKAEAELMLPDLVRSVRGMRQGDTEPMSWALFKTKYLEYSKTNKTGNTHYKDTHAFELVDRFADLKQLQDMTPERLEDLKAEWMKHTHAGKGHQWQSLEKIGPSTIVRSVKAIKRAMRRAEDLKWVPIQNWRVVKVEEPGGRLIHYSLEQFRELLKVCDPPWKIAAMLMGRGGLRSGEAWNLEWPDVQFEQRRLRIHSHNGWRIKGDKKGNAEKYIPMEPDLYDFLASRRKSEGFLIDEAGYGDRMSVAWFLTKFKKFLKRANLPGSPHALRHTCGAMMVSNGASLEQAAGVLGHKNLKATQIYAHLSPQAKEQAINRLPRL